jgi:hypothetical protein
MTFPGAGAQVYYNDDGEPLGWDYPNYDEPPDVDEYYDDPYGYDDVEDDFEEEDEEPGDYCACQECQGQQ